MSTAPPGSATQGLGMPWDEYSLKPLGAKKLLIAQVIPSAPVEMSLTCTWHTGCPRSGQRPVGRGD